MRPFQALQDSRATVTIVQEGMHNTVPVKWATVEAVMKEMPADDNRASGSQMDNERERPVGHPRLEEENETNVSHINKMWFA